MQPQPQPNLPCTLTQREVVNGQRRVPSFVLSAGKSLATRAHWRSTWLHTRMSVASCVHNAVRPLSVMTTWMATCWHTGSISRTPVIWTAAISRTVMLGPSDGTRKNIERVAFWGLAGVEVSEEVVVVAIPMMVCLELNFVMFETYFAFYFCRFTSATSLAENGSSQFECHLW